MKLCLLLIVTVGFSWQEGQFYMSAKLRDKDAQAIKEIIDGWPLGEKLTWKELIRAVKSRMHAKGWTRQALFRHSDIFDAYKLKKEAQWAYKRGIPASENTKDSPPELQTALKIIARLESETERLNRENERLKEIFTLWAYNAHSFNITEEMLNRPLPTVDRGASKK